MQSCARGDIRKTKPDVSPCVSVRVRPRTPIQRQQRNAQQKRRHNAPAGISNSESKEKLNLVGVSRSFDEIRLKMSLDADPRWLRSRNPQTIYPQVARKSSLKPGIFRLFSIFLREHSRICGTTIMKMLQIRQDSSMPSCRCRDWKKI